MIVRADSACYSYDYSRTNPTPIYMYPDAEMGAGPNSHPGLFTDKLVTELLDREEAR